MVIVTSAQQSEPAPRSKTRERQRELVRILTSSNGVMVDNQELASRVGVSIATLRRDLRQLETSGVVERGHGGVVLSSANRASAMTERQMHARSEKMAIARAAAELVHDGDLVILDAGSTAEEVAEEIGQKNITVVTNGIRSINRLALHENVQVMVLGGYLRGSNGTICGGEAEDMVSRVHGDIAFVGAVRVSPRRGIASLTYDQARLKSLMMSQAKRVCVIADSSKFSDDDEYPYWSPMPASWMLITDRNANAHHLEMLRAQGADQITFVDPQD